MPHMIMLDIEATGVDFDKDDALQIAALHIVRDGFYWHPKEHFDIPIYTNRDPEGDFAKAHLQPIFERSKRTPERPVQEIREDLTQFFRKCGFSPPNTYLCGMNVGTYDVPFLVGKGFLMPYKRVGESAVGDIHYRMDDIVPRISHTLDILKRTDRNGLCEEAMAMSPVPIALPTGRTLHDALYDCYRQTALLNGLIHITRTRVILS